MKYKPSFKKTIKKWTTSEKDCSSVHPFPSIVSLGYLSSGVHTCAQERNAATASGSRTVFGGSRAPPSDIWSKLGDSVEQACDSIM